jgi:cell division protein FtsI/penicillin-binding protein 2
MDPYTGEIYAMATYPSYDANDYKAIARHRSGTVHRPDRLDRLRAGSVFKMMTAAAALDERHGHAVDPDQGRRHAHLDNGQDQDRRRGPQGHGLDDVRGRRRLFAQRGRRQGGARARQDDPRLVGDPVRHVDPAGLRPADRDRLAGEVGASSAIPALTKWRQIDLANGAFGQGVAVTPIQLATAYAALMNGGRWSSRTSSRRSATNDVLLGPPPGDRSTNRCRGP